MVDSESGHRRGSFHSPTRAHRDMDHRARQRVKAGLKRAVAQGVKLGRPKIDSATERKVRKQLAKGVGILKVAKSLGIGTATVQRISKERPMSPRGAQQ
jgi:DNA invertase Pin-like site-specific DNA recombinase